MVSVSYSGYRMVIIIIKLIISIYNSWMSFFLIQSLHACVHVIQEYLYFIFTLNYIFIFWAILLLCVFICLGIVGVQVANIGDQYKLLFTPQRTIRTITSLSQTTQPIVTDCQNKNKILKRNKVHL